MAMTRSPIFGVRMKDSVPRLSTLPLRYSYTPKKSVPLHHFSVLN